jgi:type III secretion system regulator LcrR
MRFQLQEDAPATMRMRAAVVAALEAEGVAVRAGCALGDPVPTPYSVEHSFERFGYRLTFRVVEPHWLLIAMYERLVERPTMRDPFYCMAWFIDLLRRSELNLEYVLGRVETAPFRQGRDLDDQRLRRYYLRWGGAEDVALDAVPGLTRLDRAQALAAGIHYVRVGVRDFRMPKQRHWQMMATKRRVGEV